MPTGKMPLRSPDDCISGRNRAVGEFVRGVGIFAGYSYNHEQSTVRTRESHMSAEQPPHNPDDPSGPSASYSQEVRHSQVTARVPDKVARGVFSTGAMVMQGPHEFVLDFVLRLGQPQQIVSRVILPSSVMGAFINALRENLANYQSRFGPPPPLPAPPPNATPTPIEEIYNQLKLPDDMLSGSYANTVMIGHSASEFSFDFITNFYPKSAVSCRVYLSAPQIPGLLNSLSRAFQQYQQKLQPPPPP